MLEKAKDRIVPYMDRLFRYAWSLKRDDEAAGDLLQDAMQKALSAKKVPHEEKAYRAWLFRIVRNHHVDGLRRRRLEQRYMVELEDMENDPSMEYSTDDNRLFNQMVIRKGLAELPEGQREIIILVDVIGMSYKEVAEVCEVPVGTVMSRLSRARTALLELTSSQPLSANRTDNVVDMGSRRTRNVD